MDVSFLRIMVATLIGFIMLAAIVKPSGLVIGSQAKKWLEAYTDDVDALPDKFVNIAIILAAGLGLYMELTIIRLHSSYFQLFAYFKNLSLLSCFLGLGIGYARASQRPLTLPLVFPILGLEIAFLYLLRTSPVSTLLQNPISEQLYLGMQQASGMRDIALAYGFLTLVFAFNALCFVPLGQLASRLMSRRKTLIAYGWNLVGSVLGVLLFSFLSFLWAPPVLWILLAALVVIGFLGVRIKYLLPSGLALILLMALLSVPLNLNSLVTFSPYQILTLVLSGNQPTILETSNAYYQRILDLREKSVSGNRDLTQWADYYNLPYLFKPKPQDVLVVGSGTGNDAAAAIRNGAGQIDAVEIDPAILQFGIQLHPESPYQAANVRPIVEDARAFIRRTDKKYDLLVYGLLDSHTLLSGSSGGIRLDSYVYTIEGFREARKKLKEGGVMTLTFAVMNLQLGHKLYLMLQEAFDGVSPEVYQVGYDGGFMYIAGAKPDSIAALPPTIRRATTTFGDDAIRTDTSTDDWPFFYMPVRTYPASYVVMIVILLAMSLLLIRRLVPQSDNQISIPCFFLGAGFMLVETKAITELALVYGSTWIVISAVIVAILILGFVANYIVSKLGAPSPVLTYGLLFASLLVGLGLSYVDLSALVIWQSRVIMTLVLTLPLFFSGFAFSSELGRGPSIAGALAGNLLGAILGGFLEYNSMYFGFRSLYILALAIYLCAYFASARLSLSLPRVWK